MGSNNSKESLFNDVPTYGSSLKTTVTVVDLDAIEAKVKEVDYKIKPKIPITEQVTNVISHVVDLQHQNRINAHIL
jgi:hypothetical protein